MNLDFVARNTELNDQIREFAADQLKKVVRFLEEPIEIRFCLEERKYRRIADLHIGHRFGVIQATDETGDMREAIRLAVEKAEKQAKRARQKAKDRKRRARKTASFEWPIEILDPATLQAVEGPTVIESRTFHLEGMGLEQAVEKMEEVGLGFFVYRDSVSGRVSILYNRKDDTLGLLYPEI
jgi:putative sigma-54 modulation protein